jgi:hypothetical protein
MYRSKMISKRAVDETVAMGIAQKHQVPLLPLAELSSVGLPTFQGGGSNLSVSTVMIQDDHGVVPALLLESQDGWSCVLDQWAIEDLIVAFSNFKPKIELMNTDLKPPGFLV